MSDFIRKFKSLREKIVFNQNLRKLQEYEKSAARLPLFIDYCGCEWAFANFWCLYWTTKELELNELNMAIVS